MYLVFELEKSVRALLQACSHDPLSPDGLSEYYFKMSSRRMRCKEVSEHWVLSGSFAGLRGQFSWGGRTRRLQASVQLRQEAPPASQQIQQNALNSIKKKKKKATFESSWYVSPAHGGHTDSQPSFDLRWVNLWPIPTLG